MVSPTNSGGGGENLTIPQVMMDCLKLCSRTLVDVTSEPMRDCLVGFLLHEWLARITCARLMS